MRPADETTLDYLAVGHVTWDWKPEAGLAVGGTAAYAALTAQALGCRVGVVTRAAPDLDLAAALPGVQVVRAPSPITTTFHNQHTPEGRRQVLRAVAAPLGPDILPREWRTAHLLHLGPVAGECDPAWAAHFPAAFVGLTPQGWLRQWDAQGHVGPAPWEDAGPLLRRADAVVLSDEDAAGDGALVAAWASQARVLALTRGAAGCTLFVAGEARQFDAFPATEVDSTGAGDVFAAVFFVRLWRGDGPGAAARWANCLAAASVSRRGLAGVPTAAEVARCS
ncbi:MAG: ribokinase [Anaerolineae bacterium]|nr:ribokinase [Anaerolineae bacterium]